MGDNSISCENSRRLTEEKAEQARWQACIRNPKWAWFKQLVKNEFFPTEQQQAETTNRLIQILTFAAAEVPYYRDLFARLKLSVEDITSPEQLIFLPELTKAVIQEQENRMRPRALPSGQKYGGSHASSGSTGKPVRVHQTEYVRFMRLLLTQRQLRWYRFDPTATMGTIRSGSNFPNVNGHELGLGQTVTIDAWPGVGKFFTTGRFLGFHMDNPLESMATWLEQHRPDYLFSTTGIIEHLAFEFQEREKLDGLMGIRTMSEPLTAGQQTRIQEAFDVPIHISYGLDEVGWVATRCAEGGRYHVHTEYCLVEIVDEEGKPCRAGEFGRVLVTILANPAMPLIRYVTDDIAQALHGPCSCGRTLPAFGNIVGRHSLMKGLPEGTIPVVSALRSAMDHLPRELSLSVREYQVRQSLDGNFKLCLVLAGPRAEGFDEHVENVFNAALVKNVKQPGPKPTLTIFEVLQIPLAPSKKFFHFVSEFTQPELAKDQAEFPTKKQ